MCKLLLLVVTRVEAALIPRQRYTRRRFGESNREFTMRTPDRYILYDRRALFTTRLIMHDGFALPKDDISLRITYALLTMKRIRATQDQRVFYKYVLHIVPNYLHAIICIKETKEKKICFICHIVIRYAHVILSKIILQPTFLDFKTLNAREKIASFVLTFNCN